MKTEVKRLPGSQVEIKITVPARRVGDFLQKTMAQASKEVKVKGFRQGHAPANLAKEKLDIEKVYGELLNQVVSEAYAAAIKEHFLKPIVSPKIEVEQFDQEAKKDLIFKATTAERPKIEVGDYKRAVAGLKAEHKIVGPNNGQPLKSSEVLATVVRKSKVELPELLLEAEVNRMLSRLVDQTTRLGLTVEQYLTSQGKTAESLRAEYHKQAEDSLKTEFVLDEIANLEKVEVTDKEIDEAIQANPDEKSRKEFAREGNRWYIRSVLKRNKTLQRLLELTK